MFSKYDRNGKADGKENIWLSYYTNLLKYYKYLNKMMIMPNPQSMRWLGVEGQVQTAMKALQKKQWASEAWAWPVVIRKR